jgi:hypothetical protein
VRTLPATPEDLDELKALMAVERDSTVKATIVLALDPHEPVLVSLISPIEDPLVRLCAAAQLIPRKTDLGSLVLAAQESAPLCARFAELPIVQEDTDPIRLIASRLGIVAQDEQVRWIGNWLRDRAWSVPALYAAADTGETRRSTARLLIEPVAEVVKHPPDNDPEIQSTAAFALLELGLPGLERLRELAPSLTGAAQEMVNRRLMGTESRAALYANINLNRTVSPLQQPLDLAAKVTAASLGTISEWDGINALDDLASWGTKAIDQTNIVEQFLDHPRSALLRIHSAWALARIANETTRSVAVLIREFQPGVIGSHVAQILGELGQDASAALPILRAYVSRDRRPPDVSALEDDLLAKACIQAMASIEAVR